MNQFRLISLILVVGLILLLVESVESRRIIWQQRTNIGDAGNWEGETMPCSSDALLFPQQSYELIKLSNITMKEIILPKSGGFILDRQTSLNFRENDSKCRPNGTRIYKSVIQSPWLSSSNWVNARDPDDLNGNLLINAATPHDERIPCDNDEIIFPINNSYVVDLQSLPYLTFKTIAIDGRVMSVNDYKEFLYSTYGQSSFKNIQDLFLRESSCNDGDKCVCHEKVEALREILCENEKPFCQPIPHCSDPIKPLGHCCLECGAMFQMKISSINNFNIAAFKERIEKAIMNGAATSVVDREKIVHHISVTRNEQQQLYLQLIIVDRYEYNEHSTRLMEHLKTSLLNDFYKNQSKFYFISGLPFIPNASGHVLTFILGTFFIVTLFMTLIYIGYYDDRHIPRLMAMIRSRQFLHPSDVFFARFDNAQSHVNGAEMMEADDNNSIMEVDLHFGTDQSIEDVNRAFNNPMFDAVGGKSSDTVVGGGVSEAKV